VPALVQPTPREFATPQAPAVPESEVATEIASAVFSVQTQMLPQPASGRRRLVAGLILGTVSLGIVGAYTWARISADAGETTLAHERETTDAAESPMPAAEPLAEPPAAPPAVRDEPRSDPPIIADEPAPTEPEPDPTPTPEPPRTDPSASKPQPAKTQPAKTQPAKTQPAKTQPAKTQPAKTQPAKKSASSKPQPAKPEPSKAVAPARVKVRRGNDYFCLEIQFVSGGRTEKHVAFKSGGTQDIELPPGRYQVQFKVDCGKEWTSARSYTFEADGQYELEARNPPEAAVIRKL
jgi:hypothetical protein